MRPLSRHFCYVGMVLLLLFLNVWQSFRFHEYREELKTLEEKQRLLLEQNMKILTSIAVFDSPERIAQLAEEELGLKKIAPDHVIRLKKDPEEGSS